MTMTAISAERTAPSIAPLAPRPDQRERWLSHRDPVSFDQAAQSILDAHAADGVRDDIMASEIRSWAFGSRDGSTMELVPVPLPGRPHRDPLALRDLAFGQLCQRVGAPAPYLKSLPAKLQIANVNWGLATKKASAMLRCAGNEVRAIVSDRYAALDDALVLDLVGDTLERAGYRQDTMVRAVAVGPHTVLRITLPGEGRAVRVGDVIEHGIDIANSELGLRSVQVTPTTYRLICTNGMRAWKSDATMRMRHIGDPDRLRAQLADAIPVAFAEARGDLDRWARSVDTLVDNALAEIEDLRGFGLSTGDISAVGRELAGTIGALPESTGQRGVTELLKDAHTSAFDVANAVTAVARGRSTASRLTLEEAGHRYLRRAAA